MKKLLILLLVAAFAVSMLFIGIGCKEEVAPAEEMAEEEEEAVEEEEEEVAEPVVIELWSKEAVSPSFLEYYQAVKDGYEELNPNVTINITAFEGETYIEKLKVALAGGAAPDMFTAMEYLIDEYVKAGVLLELTDIYAADAYDAVKLLADAIESVGNSGPKIKDYLYGVKDYPGAGGITTFDEDGAVVKPVMFKKFENGEFIAE